MARHNDIGARFPTGLLQDAPPPRTLTEALHDRADRAAFMAAVRHRILRENATDSGQAD